MSMLQAVCKNCAHRESLFPIDRPLVRGTKLTAEEVEMVVKYQDEPCSSCGEPLKDALLWSEEMESQQKTGSMRGAA